MTINKVNLTEALLKIDFSDTSEFLLELVSKFPDGTRTISADFFSPHDVPLKVITGMFSSCSSHGSCCSANSDSPLPQPETGGFIARSSVSSDVASHQPISKTVRVGSSNGSTWLSSPVNSFKLQLSLPDNNSKLWRITIPRLGDSISSASQILGGNEVNVLPTSSTEFDLGMSVLKSVGFSINEIKVCNRLTMDLNSVWT